MHTTYGNRFSVISTREQFVVTRHNRTGPSRKYDLDIFDDEGRLVLFSTVKDCKEAYEIASETF